MIKSFIKWAGIKPSQIEYIDSVISPNFTYKDFTLVIPGAGAGEILFYMMENYTNIINCIITDASKEITNLYRVMKDDSSFEELKHHLTELESFYKNAQDKKYQFNVFRYAYNGMITGKTSGTQALVAALFIFLGKTCYNGLYRTNSRGEFNSAWSSKEMTEISFFDEEEFNSVHKIMKNVEILDGDIESVAEMEIDGNVLVVADSLTVGNDVNEHINRLTDKGTSVVYVCPDEISDLYASNIYSTERIVDSDMSIVCNYTVNGRLF